MLIRSMKFFNSLTFPGQKYVCRSCTAYPEKRFASDSAERLNFTMK